MPRRVMHRFTVLLAACMIAAAVWGCGTQGADQGPGSLLLLRPVGSQYNIFERQLADGTEHELLGSSERISGLRDPALSPDGKRIAYVYMPLRAATADRKPDIHGDIWIAARDGSDARMVYQHERPNQIVGAPAWIDDDHLAVIVRDADDLARIETYRFSLDRITISAATRVPIIPGALSVGLSPKRDEMVYSTFVAGGEQIYRSNVDGSDVRLLMDSSARLFLIRSPRFSPDGKTVVFTAADVPQATRPQRSVSIRGTTAPVPAPARHGGIVSNVWTIDAEGGSPRLLAQIDEDDPSLTFSANGKHLYVMGVTALYDVEVASGVVTRLGDGAIASELAWAPGD